MDSTLELNRPTDDEINKNVEVYSQPKKKLNLIEQ